ncbi:potassium channel protein [Fulvivirgaceae bacterium BMA10]|uniref:Potassium channel protein n=1 Tax=Splendidivirga corallicola TaxID=3051826 RepID=A0ABT8KM35_9BACT|nr:potassium channel protein [Fulvivirgaceae bacterium BMA10]
MRKSLKRLIKAGILLILSIAAGIFGYMGLEGYSLQDAMYMTVVTISTVGFQEVHPLSGAGKIFTTIYIIFNLGIFAYVISIFTTYLFEGELQQIFKEFLQGREVKNLKDHVIVCGYGRNGKKTCEELINGKLNFVVIERNEEIPRHLPDYLKSRFLIGNATLDDALHAAGIERASAIITTLPNDADNVFISLTARELNPKVNIIARASEENTEKKLYRAGASHVVMPDTLGGLHMAHLVTKPFVIEFLELLSGVGETKLMLEEFSFECLNSTYRNKTIRELDVRNETGVTIVGFKDNRQGFKFNPDPNTKIGENDVLIVLGIEEDIEKFKKRYS